jgi:hypothetical protein
VISRKQVARVMRTTDVDGLTTVDERNAARRNAVEEFLAGETTVATWVQGSETDMILSDLQSYREWEKEDEDAAF